MKRIIFTITNDLTHDRRMQRICGGLVEEGYDVLLVGRNRGNSKPLDAHPFRQRRLNCFFEKGKLFYIEYNIRLFFFLLFKRCDIICGIDLDTLLACTLAAKIRGKKLAYDAHEYFTEVPEVVDRPVVKRIWRWVENFCVPKCDLCYTVGPALAELFEKKHGKKFYVIRNVPVLDDSGLLRHRPGQEGVGGKYILYQGALNIGRGLKELIGAMKHLDISLKIAGEGDLSEELRDLAKKLGVADKVYFLGWVHPDQLRELTTNACIGYNVLAEMGLSYYYSLSNKFFDYIHAAIPSLSNPFPEYKAINERYEVTLYTNLSEAEIVHNIERLLKDAALYNYLKGNCVKARLELNWQQEVKELRRIYGLIG
jgi:glycosyltransferase involved in cell wall biosynthesis